MLSRRQLLFTGTRFFSALALCPCAVWAHHRLNGAAGLEALSYAALCKLVGTTFFVQRGAGAEIALELVEARQQPPPRGGGADAPDAGHEKFSLHFRGPRREALTQRTYTFEHRRIGRFEMFIVPAGESAQGDTYYEAVFNRPAGRRVAA